MKPLSDALGAFAARLKSMPLPRQLALIASVALLVGLSVWGWAAMTAPRYGVLFGHLESEDAAEIMERLKGAKVAYKLEDNGTQILVPEEQVHELRLTLAGEGLPSGGGAGFELFDQQRFGESEFSEQVKYHRALEGELSRTIAHLSGVESARVHLVLPARSLFATQDNAASASVALRLRRGAQLSRDVTRGIVHLVASSVRGLKPEAVTIVDGSGRRLAGLEDENQTANTSLEFQRNYEHSLEAALRQILDAAVGPGKSVVRVAAEVSFTREETTEERVDPNQTTSRSFQIVEEREGGSTSTSGGVPGAVSTLEGSDPNMATDTKSGLVRRSETRNFEVSKTVRKAVEPVGRVTRISLAVAVDGTWKGEGDKRTFVPRKPEELAQLRNLVASAAGVKDARGDQLTIECVPFTEADEALSSTPEDTSPVALARKHWPITSGVFALLFVLTGTTIWLLLSRGKGAKGVSVELPRVGPGGVTVESRNLDSSTPAGEHLLANAGRHAALPGGGDAPENANGEEGGDEAKADAERIRAMTLEIATGDPYLAASVIRGWLKDGEKSKTNGEAAA
jgi:flagellar M-ring protein FliF